MQLEALKIFCDVARLHSFSRGAEENDVTQSTASQTVHHLEEHLGVTLIERSRRPLRLTAEGKVFYDGCREITHRYATLESAVRNAHGESNAVVRVAAIYSVGLGDMTQHTQRFAREHPGSAVEIEYLSPERVYASVLEDRVDFGIVSFPQARRDIEALPWRDEPMVVVCHPAHRLAREKKLAWRDLAGEKFVAFDEHLTIRREIDRALKRHGVRVEVELEFDNVEAIKRAVEVNSGLAILPAPTLQHELSRGTLVAAPLTTRRFVRPLGFIHRRGKTLYPNTRQFIELLRGGASGVNGNGHAHGRH